MTLVLLGLLAKIKSRKSSHSLPKPDSLGSSFAFKKKKKVKALHILAPVPGDSKHLEDKTVCGTRIVFGLRAKGASGAASTWPGPLRPRLLC